MSSHSISKNAIVVSMLTVISRVSGFVRDTTISHLFGAGSMTDAFVIAFIIPNMFRRFLAEGALSIAFVPTFSRYNAIKSRDEYQDLLSSTITLLSAVAGSVVFLGIVFSPYIVRLFAPGFSPEQHQLSVTLNRIMFPYLFFISLTSFFIGVLHSKKSFAVPATSQIELNIVMALSAILFYKFFDIPIYSLALGVILGGLLQLITQAYYAIKMEYFIPRFMWNPSHPDVNNMMLLMLPTTAAIAIYQLNLLVSKALASLISNGTVTYIYLSDRIFELPLGVFAVAIATVSHPVLSELYAKNDMEEFKGVISKSIRSALFVCIPAMFGVVALNIPIISYLFQHGKFTYENTLECAPICLNALIGLFAVAGTRNITPAFYAMQDVKTPVIIAFLSFMVNLTFSLILIGPLGGSGLTLANSISNTFNFLALGYVLYRKVGDYGVYKILITIIKTLLASFIMFFTIFWVSRLPIWIYPGNYGLKTAYLFGSITVGMLTFVLVASLLGTEEIRSLAEKIKTRIKG
ncbi:MAG: murein biosynthesis integral membrane protein MurJ [Deltaproteobacteria bacterium]|nr:murein biosynthesis integral membrane protein MurJ [Deltaproteobacteria bacterium]